MNSYRTIAAAVMASALLFAHVQSASSQEAYPSKPITIVVPFAAGGVTDFVGRLVGKKMGDHLNQTVIVENAPGASTMIGAERVSRSSPDGYTLLIGTSTTFSTNPHLYKNIRYSIDNFEPVTVLSKIPFAAAMNKDVPANNVKEFIEFAKKKSDGIDYGTTGTGGVSHLIGAMMGIATKLPMHEIPYKGSAPAMIDVLGGRIQIYFDAITTSLPLYKEGKIKILGVTSLERSAAAPEIPTFAEAGYPDVVLEFRLYLLAPKGTPKPIVDKLNAAALVALADPEVKKRLEQDAAIPEPRNPGDSLKIMKDENEAMGKIIRTLGISLNE
jgi:tripartite-type tricarboxylate transporter receptor subunit TctC